MRRYALVVLTAVAALTVTTLVGCPRKQLGIEPPPPPPLGEAQPVTLTMYGPCGMVLPFMDAIAAFEQQHPDIHIEAKYDNSVIVAKRLTDKGETCDIFVSPGPQQMALLTEKSLIDESTVTAFCDFELVTIIPRENPAGIEKPEDLLKATVVSIPDPELDSVGHAGKQALESLKLWKQLEDQKKLLVTSQAIESHKFVAQGKSQAGIAFKGCPLETNPEKLSKSKVQVAFDFPEGSYETPQGLIAVTKNCAQPDAAKTFISFLISAEGQKIIADSGLKPVPAAAGAAGVSAPTGGGSAVEMVDAGTTSAGPDDAKVVIQAFYPRTDHGHIIEAVFAYVDKYPGKVRAEYYDWAGSAEARQVWRDNGLSCGAILINGKQTFDIKDEAGSRQVTFMMAMDGEWTKADLDAVVLQAVNE
jgi:molybdenum ABC transporter molybdate-binding protein